MAAKLNSRDVVNYPSELPNTFITARPRDEKIHFYVMQHRMEDQPDGSRKQRSRILGKIVDMHYYSMEDYKRLFKKDGSRRPDETTERAERKRSYTRRTPINQLKVRRQEGLPDVTTIEGFPHDNPRARLLRIKDVIYVVASTYTTLDGKHKEQRQYLGRVMDGVFVSSEEYRARYGRSGRKNQTISK